MTFVSGGFRQTLQMSDRIPTCRQLQVFNRWDCGSSVPKIFPNWGFSASTCAFLVENFSTRRRFYDNFSTFKNSGGRGNCSFYLPAMTTSLSCISGVILRRMCAASADGAACRLWERKRRGRLQTTRDEVRCSSSW